MAKNELLPFADGEDANVLPTNQWEALTDILENGFQSGIARSEQVNRVLAQGAVASYVLGQLIVDRLNKDATLDKDTLYQNLISALQENSKDACLPLSGGTMQETIDFAVADIIERTVDDSYVAVRGGTGYSNGASLILYGKDSSGNEGVFRIIANNGSTAYNLYGYSNGNLTWGGKKVEVVNSNSANYVRYESGLQMCVGTASSVNNSGVTVTFPVAFSATPVVVATRTGSAVSDAGVIIKEITKTGVTLTANSSSGTGARWIAYGKWK